MPVQLDYHKPPVGSHKRIIALAGATALSLVGHLAVFRFFVESMAANDVNVRFTRCVVISLGYWFVVLLIVTRSRLHPTIADLALIAVGYPAVVLACHVVVKDGL